MAQQTYKFIFSAQILDFNLKANISCKIYCTWKRSNESASSTPVEMMAGKANINQTLSIPVNMYLDTLSNSFIEKKSGFSFTMITPKGDKTAGVVNVDLSQMLNHKIDILQQNFTLEKCPVAGAYVFMKITAKAEGEGPSDSKSIQSINDISLVDNQPTNQSHQNKSQNDKLKQLEATINQLSKENRDLKDQVKILKKTISETRKEKSNQKSNNNEKELTDIRSKLEHIYKNLKTTFEDVLE